MIFDYTPAFLKTQDIFFILCISAVYIEIARLDKSGYTYPMSFPRKLPIGVQSFKDLREKHFLYVDKTAYIYQLSKANKVYFLSRPRQNIKNCTSLYNS